ncbi:protein of unknown function [Streptantibioticus cattleyicolor NRRL 8057 = DSM 46488]|nr:protein of unknown function [Streptantibioticus cattleyicolor NRRL 8057 = DSM 46488]
MFPPPTRGCIRPTRDAHCLPGFRGPSGGDGSLALAVSHYLLGVRPIPLRHGWRHRLFPPPTRGCIRPTRDAHCLPGFRGPSGVTPRSRYPPQLGSGYWVAAGTPLHAPVLLCSALRHGVGEKEIGVTPTSSLTPTREERHPHDGARGCAGGVPAATQQPEPSCGGYAERGVTPGAPPTPYRQ